MRACFRDIDTDTLTRIGYTSLCTLCLLKCFSSRFILNHVICLVQFTLLNRRFKIHLVQLISTYMHEDIFYIKYAKRVYMLNVIKWVGFYFLLFSYMFA